MKKKYKEAVLLFGVGELYETFNADAEILARHGERLLVVVTQNLEVRAAASLPHYALHRAKKAGYKVAVWDQLEAPKQEPLK